MHVYTYKLYVYIEYILIYVYIESQNTAAAPRWSKVQLESSGRKK